MAPVNSRDDVLSGIYSVLVQNLQNSQQTRHWPNAGPMLTHHLRRWPSITGSTPRVCWAAFNPVNIKHLYNVGPTAKTLCRRCTHVYTIVLCLLGIAAGLVLLAAHCWPWLQADTDPMSVKCWASVTSAGQYPFCPSQYFILPYLHAGGTVWARCLNQSWVNVGPPSVTLAHIQRGAKHDMVTQYWVNAG